MRADHLLIRVRPRSKPILTLACLGGIALIPAPAGAQPLSADRVLVNGHILTVDARDSIAQAVAIRAGRIVAVGTNAQIEALADARSERIDLHGLTVTPGLIDAHIHLAEGGLDALYLLDLSYPAVTSIEEVVAKVRTRAAEEEPGAWVRGRGWDEGKLTENRYIYASDLDAAAPDRPVWLSQTMGHYGVANSAALARAGITRDTPDPPGGVIDRSADGTPTGVLKETAQALVTGLIPEPTPAQRRAAIEQLAQALNAEGMTAAKDPRIGLESWDAYQQVLAEGKLSVRVFVLWGSPDTLDGARDLAARIAPFSKPYLTTGDDHLISGGVKIFADGSGGARTAWMYKDWNKNYSASDGGNRGYPALDPELLRQQILLYHDAGLHLGVHAIGDRAIDWVVDSYALALQRTPAHGRRHSIIHANLPTEHALETMAELQRKYDAGFPEVSATFMWWIGDTYAGNYGPERARRLIPLHSYAQRGIRWAEGSDFDVTPFAARYGLWALIARQPALGVYGSDPYGRAEAADVHDALRAQTMWAAHQLFLDDKIGSIEVGKYADIAVWDKNLTRLPWTRSRRSRAS